MKIAFEKVKPLSLDFDIAIKELEFKGSLKKINSKIVECKASMCGSLDYTCDRCGDDMVLSLKEDLNLALSDGIYRDPKLSDTIEIFGGEIDLEEIFRSEIEAYKSGYFYCENCKNLKGE